MPLVGNHGVNTSAIAISNGVKQLKDIIVGLLGFGNVGKGFATVLKKNKAYIESTLGCSITIKKILVRDPSKYSNTIMPDTLFTDNAD